MPLKGFDIGPIHVAQPVVLAALAGYTDLAYRRVCRARGAKYCHTEMMLAKLLLQDGRLRSRLVKLSDDDHPVAGQLLGNDPAEMAEAAVILGRMGFDVIDLNLACPVNKALARRRGGYLLKSVEQSIAIVRAVAAAADRPVTLKIRQKFYKADSEEAFWRVAEAAFDAGLAAICVHARSVEIKYAGPADWEFLSRVKRHFADKVIIGSGDVLMPASALEMLAKTGVDAAAAARGALGNPWFFRQAADLAEGRQPYQPTVAEQREMMLDHFAQSVDLYGPRRAPKIMRKFGIKYARLHPTPGPVRSRFIAVKNPEDWQQVVEEYYSADGGSP